MSSRRLIQALKSLVRDFERYATFQYDQDAPSAQQYEVWDRRFEENTSPETFDHPNVSQPREPYYQYQLYGKTSHANPPFWTNDSEAIQEDEGMWIDSEGDFDEDASWDVFSDLDEDDSDKEAAPRRKPSKPSAYRQYRQYWRKNRQKYREKKRKQRMTYRRKKNQILRRRKILKRRTPGRIRKPKSF